MKSVALISLLLLTLVALAAEPATIPSKITNSTISIRDLNPKNVIGLLDKPLGTRRLIGGVKAERVMLANPLEISDIDGAKPKVRICIEIAGDIKIEKGVKYLFEGYESGGFGGEPDWGTPLAQQPFQFHSIFVVTKVIEPKAP